MSCLLITVAPAAELSPEGADPALVELHRQVSLANLVAQLLASLFGGFMSFAPQLLFHAMTLALLSEAVVKLGQLKHLRVRERESVCACVSE